QPRGGDRKFGLAEIDIEIFEFGAPAAAEGALDAAAGGPSGLHVLEGRGRGPANPGKANARSWISSPTGRSGDRSTTFVLFSADCELLHIWKGMRGETIPRLNEGCRQAGR